ncbi:hypothetical protein WDU94_014767 [Cyamophila willieti]
MISSQQINDFGVKLGNMIKQEVGNIQMKQTEDYRMDDNSSVNQNGQIGTNSNNNKPDDGGQRIQYSIPGILHFIQHEWARFEMERSQWEVDKAELNARIAFLQGERKGQENLKHDLIRRIKMLEYALKQERAKYHQLKYGTELQQGDMNPPTFDEPGVPEVNVDSEAPFTSVSNISWKQGRQILRQYLQEIGYTDTIIDVRSNRVRTLLGLNNNNNVTSDEPQQSSNMNGEDPTGKIKGFDIQGRKTPSKKFSETMIMETEEAVMANFEFLTNQNDVDLDEDEDDDDDMNEDLDDMSDLDHTRTTKRSPKNLVMSEPDDVDAEAEEVYNELHLLTATEDTGSGPHGSGGPGMDPSHWTSPGKKALEEEGLDSNLGLGELAQLTVNNEADTSYDQVEGTKEPYRKTWNAKYTLRSHFDPVRALAFHPAEPVLITASDDNTLKLWNLQKTVAAKKSASLDVEPLYTFRSHVGPVLSLAMSATGEQCYSGGADGKIRCWTIPAANIDPYDSYDPGVHSGCLEGHTDAVWGLTIHSQCLQLLSCSADGTVKLWSPTQQNRPLLKSYSSEQDGNPTSIDFVRDESNKMVTAFENSACVLFDLETAKPIVRIDSSQFGVSPSPGSSGSGMQINRVVCHPTLPLTITAHEDRHIRFFDNVSGKLVHSMVAHLDAVTSLAVDPQGLYILSGSHDCSIRLWNLDNKTCVQEITAHRKKFDESILDVAFHPSKPFIASAGADGLAKVFV